MKLMPLPLLLPFPSFQANRNDLLRGLLSILSPDGSNHHCKTVIDSYAPLLFYHHLPGSTNYMVFLLGQSTSWISFLWYRIPCLINNVFHCLMNCFISWLSVSLPIQHCNSFALNKQMISPIFFSLYWASTQSNVAIHFGFNGGSLSTPG